MKIQGVLFDKDGTLIEVNATWVPIYREILKELCATDDAGAEALMQRAGYDPAKGKFAAGSLLAGGTTRQIAASFWPDLKGEAFEARVHHMDHGYTYLVRDKLTPLMPLEPLLIELRGMGLKLGVATNDSRYRCRAEAVGQHDRQIRRDHRASRCIARHGRRQSPRHGRGARRWRGACHRGALRQCRA